MAERNNQRGNRRDREETPEFADRLVAINRVSKTVKGGKRFGFAALVVVLSRVLDTLGARFISGRSMSELLAGAARSGMPSGRLSLR